MQAILAADLPQALERRQLRLLYQPLLHLPSRSITGFEALLRWRHPEFGLVLPSHFIPLAEESGWIVPLGNWVLREACRQTKIWRKRFAFLPRLSMNVNLSPQQLRPELVAVVESILAETGVAPETLGLELTESTLVPEIDSVHQVLAGLRALGVRLKLDDFGVGYSSLSYLRVLRFHTLKIDRSFVERVVDDSASAAIVESVVQLARKLRMSVLAEGIEREEQLQRLIDLGCERGQGFLFAQPLTAEAAEYWLLPGPVARDLRAPGGMLEACNSSRPVQEAGSRPLRPAANASPALPGASWLIT